MKPDSQSNLVIPHAMQRGVDKDGWRILGPGGGGAMYIPTIKPNDQDTALVACDMTGSYLTRNGGQTWKEINFKVWAGAFTFDPTQPDTIYAGATGLYRSRDSGDTWELIFPDPSAILHERFVGDHGDHSYVSNDNWPGGKVESIHVDPQNSMKITIAVRNDRIQLFISSDSGRKWGEVARLAGTRLIKSYLDPQSPANDRNVYYLTDAGFFKFSSASGAVERVQLPTSSEVSDFSAGVIPVSNRPVFYITSPGQWQKKQFVSGTFRSFDLGVTWESLNNGLDGGMLEGQSRNLNRVAVSPHDARTVYLSAAEPSGESNPAESFGIFKSEDTGASWRCVLRMGQGQPQNRTLGWIEKEYDPSWGGAPFFMSVAPSNPEVCIATDWGTTYRTTDGGKTWLQLYCHTYEDETVSTRGLDVTNTYEICFDPYNPDHVALACTDVGLFHSQNGGKSWKHAIQGVPKSWSNTCYRVLFDPQVKGKVWAAFSNCHDMPRPKMFRSGHFDRYEGGITGSDNAMESWKMSNRGLPARCVPTDLILDPNSDPARRTLYTAIVGKGVYKSVDGGESWEVKNNGISESLNAWRLVFMPDGSLYLLVCRGLNGNKIVDGALYRSTDGAASWETVLLPEGVNFPNDLCFDPSEPQRIYLACWPSPVEGVERHGGLWKSENQGVDWVNMYDESAHVYGIALNPDNLSTVIITTFEGKALVSDDRGDHWRQLNGVDFKWLKQPIFDPFNRNMVYLTTFGSSVWYGSIQI